MEKEKQNYTRRYVVFCIWAAFVTAGFAFLYLEGLVRLSYWVLDTYGDDHILDILRSSWDGLAYEQKIAWVSLLMLKTLGAVLLWWRTLKVAVLQGSPFPIGIAVGGGRQDEGRTGRNTTCAFIGNIDVYRGEYEDEFWYGTVFRAHPRSDKIVRARLEFLILAVSPSGLTIIVQEGVWLFRRLNHEERARRYRLVADKYSKTRDSMSSDRFRDEMVRHMKEVSAHHQRESRRIDGLNWVFYLGTGGGMIRDDFGYQISFEHDQKSGRYNVSETGPDGKSEAAVASIEELRELAQRELNAT